MSTLNRKLSQNVITLETECKCTACNHIIKYASKTYFEQTGLYIGLDCWEQEKQNREEQRKEQYEQLKQEQYLIDLKSQHINNIGDKISIKVKLEKIIYLYTSTFNFTEQEIFLNIFRTEDGNLITYKGKSLYYTYFELYGYELGNNDYDLYNQLYEKFDIIQHNYTDEYTTKDISIFKNSEYITLSGTIKEHTIFNDIKQTLIQRPKLKK